MQYTTNYELKKIELTDSPPDITVLNENFDIIDGELNSLSTGKETPAGAQAKADAAQAASIPLTQKGAVGGVATLDSTGKIPSAQMPALVGNKADKAVPAATGNIATLDATGNLADGGKTVATLISEAKSGLVPTSRTVNGKALSANISLTAADVSAVPITRTVNGKALASDISLASSDVGAVPTSRTINGKPLSANITLTSDDIGKTTTVSIGSFNFTTNISGINTAYFDLGSDLKITDYTMILIQGDLAAPSTSSETVLVGLANSAKTIHAEIGGATRLNNAVSNPHFGHTYIMSNVLLCLRSSQSGIYHNTLDSSYRTTYRYLYLQLAGGNSLDISGSKGCYVKIHGIK